MATSIFQLPGFCNSAVLKLLLLLLLLQTCLNVSLLIESLLLDSWETFFGVIANCLSNIRSKHNIWLIETLFQGWLVISVVAHVLKDIFLLLQWFHFYLNYVSLRRIKHTMYMFFPI